MLYEMKKLRQEAGYTQESAADALGVSLFTYRNWEQCRTMPQNKDMLLKIASLFSTTIEAMLGYDMVEPGALGGTPPAIPDEVADPAFERLVAIWGELTPEGKGRLLEQAEFLAIRHPKNTADQKLAAAVAIA